MTYFQIYSNLQLTSIQANVTMKFERSCDLAQKMFTSTSPLVFRAGLRSSIMLLPILGITWVVGFVQHLSIALTYVFVIMNSLQVSKTRSNE